MNVSPELRAAALRGGLADPNLLPHVPPNLTPLEAVTWLRTEFPGSFHPSSVRDMTREQYRAARARLLSDGHKADALDRGAAELKRIGVKS